MFSWLRRKKKKEEHRLGLTDVLLSNQLVRATDETVLAAESSAVEIAAGYLRRAFWNAEITGTDLISQEMLSWIGNDLIRYGESIFGMISGGGSPRYERSYSYDISGGYNRESWKYRLTLPAPSQSVDMMFDYDQVLHFKQSVSLTRPWRGVAPIQAALPIGDVVSRMEKSISEESNTSVGTLLPINREGSDEELTGLRNQIKNLKGDLGIVESTRSFSDNTQAAPRGDWEAKKLGMRFDNSTAAIYKECFISCLAVLGVPYEMVRGEGTSQREAYRRWMHSTVKPMARVVETEFYEKTGIKIKLGFTDLAAADIAAKARAFKSLVSSGLSEDVALQIVGIEKPMMMPIQ